MFWNEERERIDRRSLEQLQLERIERLLGRPFESLGELEAVPFTTKNTLREHYPFGLLAVPMERVVRIHASSGTTGKPTVVAYTRADMDLWAEVMARTLTAAGVTESDVVHNAYGYGLFTGGLGFGLGAETVGAATVPVSGGNTSRQLMLIEDFGATVLCCTPSYALVLAETGEQLGIDLRGRTKLRVGLFGAEPWSESLRAEIETRLGLEAFDVYGLSEIIGPGVAVECPEHDGLHLFEDHFLAEIVDPESGRRLPPDTEGELVLTTLTKEALPLVRYRTRDRTLITHEPCACGRTFARMSKLRGRTDDMLIVRGVNVFPSQIEQALLGVEGLSSHYVIVLGRGEGLDWIEVRVEPMAGAKATRDLEANAARAVAAALGIRVEVKLVPLGTLERSQGKAQRVKDQRSG